LKWSNVVANLMKWTYLPKAAQKGNIVIRVLVYRQGLIEQDDCSEIR